MKIKPIKPGDCRGAYTVTEWLGEGRLAVKCACGIEKTILVTSFRNTNLQILNCGCGIGRDLEIKLLYKKYKKGARARGHEFSLTYEIFKRLISQSCSYCNSPPNSYFKLTKISKFAPAIYNGIDRVNNSVGYIESNVVTACGMCNRAKGKMKIEEFLIWINRIRNSDFGINRLYQVQVTE